MICFFKEYFYFKLGFFFFFYNDNNDQRILQNVIFCFYFHMYYVFSSQGLCVTLVTHQKLESFSIAILNIYLNSNDDSFITVLNLEKNMHYKKISILVNSINLSNFTVTKIKEWQDFKNRKENSLNIIF